MLRAGASEQGVLAPGSGAGEVASPSAVPAGCGRDTDSRTRTELSLIARRRMARTYSRPRYAAGRGLRRTRRHLVGPKGRGRRVQIAARARTRLVSLTRPLSPEGFARPERLGGGPATYPGP